MVFEYNTEIEMMLFDKSQIVTYKQVGKKYDLDPFEAQEILQKFVDLNRRDEDGQDEKRKFHVTYIVSASFNKKFFKHLLPSQLQEGDIQTRVFLVNEEDLEKQTKDCTIHFKRVYSVHKNKIVDFNMFYTSDYNVTNRKSNIQLVKEEAMETNE